MILTQDVRDLRAHFKSVRAEAETRRKRNIDLASEVQERVVQAFVESARSKAVAEELASLKSKLAAGLVECANSRWNAHSVSKGASKVENDVINALITTSGKAIIATKRKVCIIGSELRDALMWVSAQIEIESRAAILDIRAELERDDSEALRNVATSRAVLHSLLTKVCCGLLDTTELVVGFNAYNEFFEPDQTEKARLNQASYGCTDAGGTKNT